MAQTTSGLKGIGFTLGTEIDHSAEVREFIDTYEDDDEIPAEELERVFRLAYGREATDEDRENGLWSLICAAI
jgi:hypothetical protein